MIRAACLAMVSVAVIAAAVPGIAPALAANPTQPAPAQEAPAQPAPAQAAQNQTWYTFNGDLKAQKYSTAVQITPENVGKLHVAWQFHTGDMSNGSGKIPPSDWSATPLFVNDTVYVSTPFYRIFALDPATGKVKWIFNPHAELKALTQPGMKTRGVAYWQAKDPMPGKACQKIVYVGTMSAKLYAVDADTGKPCEGFAKDGVLDIDQWNKLNSKWPLSILQPPTVYKNLLFIGWAGKDWYLSEAPPGDVFAVNAQTGALKWTFQFLPKDARKTTGTADVWASMSVDPKAGILYLPVSSPSPNFYGGNRKEKLPLVTSITALDAETGKLIWSRQLVHHDLWDYDTNSAPVLVNIHKGGKTIPALVQSTKQGFFFVLNRLTGEPIYPIDEKPVPKSHVLDEESAPTQPVVPFPKPAVPDHWPGISTIGNIVGFGYCSRTFHHMRYDGWFTPPSLQGTIVFPPTSGGVEWGGGAVDPATGTYVVNNSYVAQIYKLLPRKEYDKITKGGKGVGKTYFPQTGAPYGVEVKNFVNWLGMPCWKPPYGSIAEYDLNTGKELWKEPFGVVQKWGFYLPNSWGSVTIGAPVITRSGLIFIGASMDSRVRALDLKSGKVLWQHGVQAPAVSIPAIYSYKGKEYVVFTAGGNSILLPKVGDQIIAFALPNSGGPNS
ncbi:MAG: pyrroloquinoline quinone-dependent dehydrogenase [Acetobacteraceae bacterium]